MWYSYWDHRELRDCNGFDRGLRGLPVEHLSQVLAIKRKYQKACIDEVLNRAQAKEIRCYVCSYKSTIDDSNLAPIVPRTDITRSPSESTVRLNVAFASGEM